MAYIAVAKNKVKMLDLINNTVIGSISTGSYPSAVVDANGYLYIANSGSNNLTVAKENGAVVGSIKTGVFPNFECTSGNKNLVFVLNQLSENITEISSLSVINSIPLPAMPYAIASNYNGSIIYATLPVFNQVIAIYTKNNTVVWKKYAGFIPFGVAYDSRSNDLYVTDVGTSSVAILNATTGSLIGNLNVRLLANICNNLKRWKLCIYIKLRL